MNSYIPDILLAGFAGFSFGYIMGIIIGQLTQKQDDKKETKTYYSYRKRKH